MCMVDQKGLERLTGLLTAVSTASKPFLQQCSEAKFLALSDYRRATDRYRRLAAEALDSDCFERLTSCEDLMRELRAAVTSGYIDSACIDAMEILRTKYIQSVLRPAVRKYLRSESASIRDLMTLYDGAIRLGSLLDVAEFLSRVKDYSVGSS